MRADIYHRLSVFPLRVPPLRERGRDVLLLAGHFLEENRARLGLGTLRLDTGAQEALLAYGWPGNVRELEHLIGRSVLRAMGRGGPRARVLSLGAADLALDAPAATTTETAPPPPEPKGSPLPAQGLREAVAAFERQTLQACLARHQGNRAAAARELRMDRANLARLARRLGLE
jgi:anaerobic nitric oxide reductase transcription regulator